MPKHSLSLRFRLALSATVGAMWYTPPAHADPITAAILGTAFAHTVLGAVVTAVLTFAITSVASLAVTKLLGPKGNGQGRQASQTSIGLGEAEPQVLFHDGPL
jgi:hypothetical protein